MRIRTLTIAGAVGLCIILLCILAFVPRGDSIGENSGILGRPLRVGIVTWPGYAGGIVANNGFKPNQTSIFWKKYNLLVEFVLMEDVDARSKSFARGGKGDVDVIWTTVDFWANELPGFVKGGIPAKAFLHVDWSRGGDAIVVDASIKNIQDLKGRTIALALLTPSQWLLETKLRDAGLTSGDIDLAISSVVGKASSQDARLDFVAGRVDAAVVWEPDVTEALKGRPGSHILASTASDTFLLADLMAARSDFIARHPDVIRAFILGWLEGTKVANEDHQLVAKLLTENEPVYRDLGLEATLQQLSTVKWADLNDNAEMFGLTGKTPLFDTLYSRAAEVWVQRRYINSPVSPHDARDDTFLRQILADSEIR